MAKCFDVVGYIEPCNAVRQKYTGRALLIIGNSIQLELSLNGLLLDKIMQKTSFQELLNAVKPDGNLSLLPISINAENPFGVTVQGNTNSGRAMYAKTVPVSILSVANTAELFIMGLQKGIKGMQAILVLERTDDGTGMTGSDVFGGHSPISVDPTSVTRSEYENGGAWQCNLVCEEPVPNVICTMTDLSDTLDTLLNA